MGLSYDMEVLMIITNIVNTSKKIDLDQIILKFK